MKATLKFILGTAIAVGVIIGSASNVELADPNDPGAGGQSVDLTEEV